MQCGGVTSVQMSTVTSCCSEAIRQTLLPHVICHVYNIRYTCHIYTCHMSRIYVYTYTIYMYTIHVTCTCIYMHVSAVHYLEWKFRCFNSTIFWCWEEYFEETCVCVSPALEKLSFEVFYPSLCHIKPYFIFLKSYCWCDTVTATNYKACDDMWRVLRPASYSHFLLRPPFANSSLLGAIEGGQCVGLVNNCQRGKFWP